MVISARSMSPERLNNLEVLCSSCGVQLARLRVGLEPIVNEAHETDSHAHLRQLGS